MIEVTLDTGDKITLSAKKFKGGKTGWYARSVLVIDGKRYMLNFMLYEEK